MLCSAIASLVTPRRKTDLLSSRLVLVLLLSIVDAGISSVARGADELIDYQKQIKPILTSRCVSCHGVLKQEGNLRLDTAAFAMKGGDSGAAIVPGNAEASLILARISARHESERMPPEGEPLKPEQISTIRTWIYQNAKSPADEVPERDPRDHWAFKPIVRPAVPFVERPALEHVRWMNNSIDAFISQGHREHGLTPQPPANKRVWLRRVSLGLVGLPPTAAELDAFVSDQSSEAETRVVSRLLESPQYGERWGRHWMDVWRYSDWWGFGDEVRHSQKHIWHWRDWIVESLNEDKGYDQMLREMIAADELYPNDLNKLRANGYLARPFFLYNRTLWLDELIEHTGKGLLGLTMNCCKCHDHKYDPLSQVEYHNFRAIFEPYQLRTEMFPGQVDFEKDGITRAFDAHLEKPTYVFVRGAEDNPDKSRVIEPTVPAVLRGESLNMAIEQVQLPIDAQNPGLRDYAIASHRESAKQKITDARAAIETAKQKLAQSEVLAKELAIVEGKKAAERAIAMAKPADALLPANASPILLVRDDFAFPNSEIWMQLSGSWKYENGRLKQLQADGGRAALQLRQLPPTDFEVRLKYIPGSGGVYKSIGIACDMTDVGSELIGYVSALDGDAKAQISFKPVNGAYVYPASAMKACSVELNRAHEIVLQVRGKLINLSFDGQPAVALRLPSTWERQPGHLALVAFDAAVELVSFELSTLAGYAKLVNAEPLDKPATEPKLAEPQPLPLDQAKLVVTIAEKAVVTAEAYERSMEARTTADRARHLGLNVAAVSGESGPEFEARQEGAVRELIDAAIYSENVLAVIKADEEISRAELAFLQAPAHFKPNTQKAWDDAKAAYEKAKSSLVESGESHTPLPGSKRTVDYFSAHETNKPYPSTSTGRRAAFAKWLTDPRNPLPARVAVNHIWARHTGKPLVATVFDFGRKGQLPSHPELLDWLASELIEHNWSMKHIHRLIVTSETYRLSSSSANANEATIAADRDNRYYWRMNPVRMDSQVVRDSVLALAGEIDLTVGGPPIPIKEEGSRRRSLYFVHSNNDRQQFLATFDNASVFECYRRTESIIPQQALALQNSSFMTEMSSKIYQRLSAAHPNVGDADFVREAYMLIMAAEPSFGEQATMSDTLRQMTELAREKKRANPEMVARTNLIQNLLNLNEFITVR